MKQLFRTFKSEDESGNEISINNFLEDEPNWEIQLISSTHPYSGYVHVVFRKINLNKDEK